MRRALFLAIALLSVEAFAYPVFYQCSKGSLSYQGKFDDGDLFEQLLRMNRTNRDAQIETWCQGAGDCMRDLKFIIDLAGANYDAAKAVFLEKVATLKIDFEAKGLPIQELDSLNKLKDAYTTLRACQETKSALDPNDFINPQQSVLTPYPYYSNYMYVTGCGGVDAKECTPISKVELDRVVKEAVLMGVDPYLVIAFSLMEGGTSEVGNLYLDPIGVMAAMGCSAKQVANNTSTDVALDSFGTSYVVNSQSIKNPKLQSKLKTYFKEFKLENTAGNSFYCYDTRGRSEPTIFAARQPNSCCIELGFKTPKSSSEQIKHALTYHFIDNITKSDFRGNKDPAWRAQRYNGYTDLMGAAEGVSPWRAGVNYYKTPSYGHQTMDFILNALLFNPYISNKVDEVTKGLGQNWESILCKGKKDGSYYVDSEYYFQQHRDAPRLSQIQEKFKRGVPFSKLSNREQRVVLADMEETSQQNSKIPDRLPTYKADSLYAKLDAQLAPKENPGDFKVLEYRDLPRDEWKQKIAGAHNLKDTELNGIHSYYVTNKAQLEELDAISSASVALYEKALKVCATLPDSAKAQACNDDAHQLQSFVENDEAGKTLDASGSSALSPFSAQFLELSKKRDQVKATTERLRSQFEKNFGYLRKKFETVSLVMQMIEQVEPLDNALARYRSRGQLTPAIEEELRSYHLYLTNKDTPYNYNDAYREYFQNIYPTRNTLSKASVFPWRKFTEAEVQKLVELYRKKN